MNRLPHFLRLAREVGIFSYQRLTFDIVCAIEGATPPSGFHVTTVYQKQTAGWRVIATHMSR
jgi:hypothetical protein